MTHEPSVGLQLLSLFHRRAFRAEAGTASRRKLSSKALVPNMILQRQHAPFFFLKGRKLRYVDGSVAGCSLPFGWCSSHQGGPFPFFFLFFFFGMRIIDKWNILCHGDGWKAYVPRSLILITKSSKRYLHCMATHNPQVSYEKRKRKSSGWLGISGINMKSMNFEGFSN